MEPTFSESEKGIKRSTSLCAVMVLSSFSSKKLQYGFYGGLAVSISSQED